MLVSSVDVFRVLAVNGFRILAGVVGLELVGLDLAGEVSCVAS
jgi:hypothetical protein